MLYVATVLTVYGIETLYLLNLQQILIVATVLTVYGIETWSRRGHTNIGLILRCNSTYRLRY